MDGVQFYFAYGSNLWLAQMAARCPSVAVVARAVLPDHAVAFPRRSVRRNCGVAGIVAHPGRIVWGVVYGIAPGDIASLDASEGYDPDRDPAENAYNRIAIEVMREGRPSDALGVFTYRAVAMPGVHRPSADYRNTIIRGAREHALPRDYIADLETIDIV